MKMRQKNVFAPLNTPECDESKKGLIAALNSFYFEFKVFIHLLLPLMLLQRYIIKPAFVCSRIPPQSNALTRQCSLTTLAPR